MPNADTPKTCALHATGTLAAITIVEAGLRALPGLALHGHIVIVVIRRQEPAAGTIYARGAGHAVGVKLAGGEGRS